jgi:2-C-methyl-D-erythritol 2,4-cyclodiphosphate synthase
VSRYRIGSGSDVHRLVVGRPLVLGGIEVPFGRGLEGHSDGDCLIHAVCDALLGAVGAGDMGRHFPSSDPKWRGVSSRLFLEETARLLAESGWVVENVDATIVAQAPALAPLLERMRDAVARSLRLEVSAVSIKAKSADELGAIGRGEGIAANAVALVRRSAEPPDAIRG